MTQMKKLADESIGTLIDDRYLIERVLGAGGMGFVVAAQHRLTGKRVALKIIPDSTGAFLERLLVEAQAPALVRHPNLVDVHDVGYDAAQSRYFLVQDLLEGEDLRSHLDTRGKLPWRYAITLLMPVMDALRAAHEAGVVHRDLKPENLFLAKERDGRVTLRVLDFGIARLTSKSSRLTTVGEMLGTPWYMSPEQARGEHDVDAQSDVWAMGVILFECLTGTEPFPGDNYNAVLNSVNNTVPPRIDSLQDGIPTALADVIELALQHDRSLRIGTMREMMDALSAVGSGPRVAAGDKTIVTLSPEVRKVINETSSGFVEPSSRWRPLSPEARGVLDETSKKRVRDSLTRKAKASGIFFVAFLITLSALFSVKKAINTATASARPMMQRLEIHADSFRVRLAVHEGAVSAPVQAPRTALVHISPRPVRRVSSNTVRRIAYDAGAARHSRNGAPLFEP